MRCSLVKLSILDSLFVAPIVHCVKATGDHYLGNVLPVLLMLGDLLGAVTAAITCWDNHLPLKLLSPVHREYYRSLEVVASPVG